MCPHSILRTIKQKPPFGQFDEPSSKDYLPLAYRVCHYNLLSFHSQENDTPLVQRKDSPTHQHCLRSHPLIKNVVVSDSLSSPHATNPANKVTQTAFISTSIIMYCSYLYSVVESNLQCQCEMTDSESLSSEKPTSMSDNG